MSSFQFSVSMASPSKQDWYLFLNLLRFIVMDYLIDVEGFRHQSMVTDILYTGVFSPCFLSSICGGKVVSLIFMLLGVAFQQF